MESPDSLRANAIPTYRTHLTWPKPIYTGYYDIGYFDKIELKKLNPPKIKTLLENAQRAFKEHLNFGIEQELPF